jgi:hypothetical protein
MNNKTASAPSKTTSPTEMTLIKYSLNGHVSKRSRGAVILASDFSALRVSLSECIKDAILRWLIDHSGFDGGDRRLESYVMKRATVNTESPLLRKTLCSQVEDRDPFSLRHPVIQPAEQKADDIAHVPRSVDYADNLFAMPVGVV